MSDHSFLKSHNYPADYLSLSEDDKQKICNGAGPAKWGWLVPDNICGMSIKSAANVHDYQYHAGRSLDDKLTADNNFLSNMFCTLIQTNHKLGVFRYIFKCLLMATIGLILVAITAIGGIFSPIVRAKIVRFMRFMWLCRYFYFVRFYGDDAFWTGKSSSKERE